MIYQIFETTNGHNIIGRMKMVFARRPVIPFSFGEFNSRASAIARTTVPDTDMATKIAVQSMDSRKSPLEKTVI